MTFRKVNIYRRFGGLLYIHMPGQAVQLTSRKIAVRTKISQF